MQRRVTGTERKKQLTADSLKTLKRERKKERERERERRRQRSSVHERMNHWNKCSPGCAPRFKHSLCLVQYETCTDRRKGYL